jgi:hypothetical protein
MLVFLATWIVLAKDSPTSQGPGPSPSQSAGPSPAELRSVAAPASDSEDCRALAASLPAELSGQRRVPGTGAAEWGKPPILLRCGLLCPPGSQPPSSGQFTSIDGVFFYIERDKQSATWYVVDRAVVAGVEIPSQYQGQDVVFDLAKRLGKLPRSATGRC